MEGLKKKKQTEEESKPARTGDFAGESGILRTLHEVQIAVPDRDFFNHKIRKASKSAQKKKKGGLFSKSTFMGMGRSDKLDVIDTREKIRHFNNSFQAQYRGTDREKKKDSQIMSIAAMNSFRVKIFEATQTADTDYNHHALAAVIKFVDLRNSAMVTDKQIILLDCLSKIGQVLHEDGGLSMFHASWFLSVYREYISRYRMFPRGKLEEVMKANVPEANVIIKKLQRKQFEVPHYTSLIDSKNREVKQFEYYASDTYVKMSKHGQRGCTMEDIKNIFLDRFRDKKSSDNMDGKLNEINVILTYALLFARIPMMTGVVEKIKAAIPEIKIDMVLFKHKIIIGQKQTLLETARGVYRNDESKECANKLFVLGDLVYNSCVSAIVDNGLDRSPIKNEIYAFPFLKQAAILINYKNIFRRKKEVYLKMIEKSIVLLRSVKICSTSGNKILMKLANNADIYEKSLLGIKKQVNSEANAGYEEEDYGKAHENW